MKFSFILLLFAIADLHGQPVRGIKSPSGSIEILVKADAGLRWAVTLDSDTVLNFSAIDLSLLNGNRLSHNLKLKKTTRQQVRKTITATVPVTRKLIPDNYNELTLGFTNKFGVIFRAYDDGVAYRIVSNFEESITIKDEEAEFIFPKGSFAWAPIIHKRPDEDIYHTSFEELYPYVSLDSLSQQDLMYSPLLVDLPSGIKVGLTESDLDDYPGMFIKGTNSTTLYGDFAPYPLKEKVVEGDYPQKVVTERADHIAATKGSRVFPWRVLLIAKEDKELPANDLVYRLASPSEIRDVSWIKPGKSTDEWIIDVNLFNVPFRSGVNTASYKYYIDFAKRFGFDRIMMDAGWSNTKDLFDINPAINMDSIAAYAKHQGIHLSMWTLAMTLDRQLDSALLQFQMWGVDFIMTDFIDRDDQPTVNFYKRIAEACAKHRIMIMYHGAYPPKGFNRTWPNNITREGVLGSEYNAWSDKVTARHNCTIPFTRMLAGPLDYEPGLLDNASASQFRPIWDKVMSQTTRCHQLALFVVYDSPMQIFSGNPSQGMMEPVFMKMLGSLPTTWDTTLVLEAKVGSHIITARRNGDSWYVGGIADSARDIRVPLSFLNKEVYKATICSDGINADRNAMDYVIKVQELKNTDNITLHLAPSGGFLAIFQPVRQSSISK